ncbi:hypothetical protein ACFV2N_41475 [Streptomyces sp. NPDC059680]|uniref:hypothetical protein n=1 Tax=Streptomyces sp. NPDC059680 TaxID=3346904 RepID=UPI00369803AA
MRAAISLETPTPLLHKRDQRLRIPAKLALITAAATALLAPLTTAPAAVTPASTHHAAHAAPARRDLPEPPPAEIVRKELGELNIAAPHSMTGYSRAKFPHWILQYGTCDTREVVLARDGKDNSPPRTCPLSRSTSLC